MVIIKMKMLSLILAKAVRGHMHLLLSEWKSEVKVRYSKPIDQYGKNGLGRNNLPTKIMNCMTFLK